MIYYISIYFVLIAFWLLISGFFSPYFIISAVVSVFISLHFYYKMNKASGFHLEKSQTFQIFTFRFAKYCLWLIKEIVVASFSTAFEMWKQKLNINPSTGWVKNNLKNSGLVTLYANSITLTPGTISIYVSDDEILVHALTKEGLDDVKSERMLNKVKELR